MRRIEQVRFIRRLAGLGLGAFVAITAPAFAAGEPLAVMVDRAKVMHIARPADVVIIGNPAIADATIQDSQTLIITGRSFGTTNLIILDSAGQAITDTILNVQASDEDQVSLYKRAARETFSCSPQCSPTLAIGDDKDWFNSVKDQISGRGDLSDAASSK